MLGILYLDSTRPMHALSVLDEKILKKLKDRGIDAHVGLTVFRDEKKRTPNDKVAGIKGDPFTFKFKSGAPPSPRCGGKFTRKCLVGKYPPKHLRSKPAIIPKLGVSARSSG